MRSFIERLFQTTLAGSFRSLLKVDVRPFSADVSRYVLYVGPGGPARDIVGSQSSFLPKVAFKTGRRRGSIFILTVGGTTIPFLARVGEKRAHQ
jgi:hypothetical protein